MICVTTFPSLRGRAKFKVPRGLGLLVVQVLQPSELYHGPPLMHGQSMQVPGGLAAGCHCLDRPGALSIERAHTRSNQCKNSQPSESKLSVDRSIFWICHSPGYGWLALLLQRCNAMQRNTKKQRKKGRNALVSMAKAGNCPHCLL